MLESCKTDVPSCNIYGIFAISSRILRHKIELFRLLVYKLKSGVGQVTKQGKTSSTIHKIDNIGGKNINCTSQDDVAVKFD